MTTAAPATNLRTAARKLTSVVLLVSLGMGHGFVAAQGASAAPIAQSSATPPSSDTLPATEPLPPSAAGEPLPPPALPTAPAEPAPVATELPPSAAVPAPLPEAPVAEPISKVPAYVLWAAGGVGLVVGTVFGISALSAKSDFDKDPTYANADKVHDRGVIADVGFGVGIVLAVTGTIFFFTSGEPEKSLARAATPSGVLSSVRVMPVLSPHSGGGALSLRF
jgi:hypothetical protein